MDSSLSLGRGRDSYHFIGGKLYMSQTLAEALLNVVGNVRYTLTESTSLNESSAAGNTMADRIIQFNNNMVGILNTLTNVQTAGGAAMVTYVQAQYNAPTLDVAGAFNSVKTALQNTIGLINTAVTGVALYVPNSTTKVIEPAAFTQAQTSGLRTQLSSLIVACNGMLPV